MFCIHKWLPWSMPISTFEVGHKQQWRVCEKCNKAQFRTLQWDKQSEIVAVVRAIMSTLAGKDAALMKGVE